MNPSIRKPRDLTAATSADTARVAAPPAAIASPWVTWVSVPFAGVALGVTAQILRQIYGPLMALGASMAPWVMVGFLLAVWASRGAPTTRKAVLVATGVTAAYLVAWLVPYHVLFVLREHVPLAAGWRQAAPWLIVTVPAAPFLGTIAALSHKRGFLGDACLVAPIAWSLPELVGSPARGLDSTAIAAPVVVLTALLILMARSERQVRAVSLLAAAAMLVAFGLAILPVSQNLIMGRFLGGGGF